MLKKNFQNLQLTLYRLAREFDRASVTLAVSDSETFNHTIQMIIVRLQDEWGHFVRNLILHSASGLGKTLSSTGVSSSIGFNGYAAVNTWIKCNRPTSRDPDWHVANISIEWAKKLKLSNYSDISAALGSTNSPETEIRLYRNFIVHRYDETAKKLRVHLQGSGRKVSQLSALPLELTPGGSTLFQSWVANIELVARVASS